MRWNPGLVISESIALLQRIPHEPQSLAQHRIVVCGEVTKVHKPQCYIYNLPVTHICSAHAITQSPTHIHVLEHCFTDFTLREAQTYPPRKYTPTWPCSIWWTDSEIIAIATTTTARQIIGQTRGVAFIRARNSTLSHRYSYAPPYH